MALWIIAPLSSSLSSQMSQDWEIGGEPVQCESCHQSTNRYEKDLLPEDQVLLAWRLWRLCPDQNGAPSEGRWFPYGCECKAWGIWKEMGPLTSKRNRSMCGTLLVGRPASTSLLEVSIVTVHSPIQISGDVEVSWPSYEQGSELILLAL